MGHLDGVRLKLARARVHVDAVQEQVGAFRRSGPCLVESQVDSASGERVFRIAGRPANVPAHLSPIVGDALFNTRSALDHLAWQLVLVNGQTPTTRTMFPVFNDAALYQQQSPSRLRGMSATAIAAVERLQPFHGPYPPWNRALWALETLHNVDKHRHLNLVVAASAGGLWDPPTPAHVKGYLGPVESGTELIRFPREYADRNYHPFFDVFFAEAPPPLDQFASVSHLPELALTIVTRIVDRFEAAFFSPCG